MPILHAFGTKIAVSDFCVIFCVTAKAKDLKTGEIVALKQVRMDRDRDMGLPLTALREIKLISSPFKGRNAIFSAFRLTSLRILFLNEN